MAVALRSHFIGAAYNYVSHDTQSTLASAKARMAKVQPKHGDLSEFRDFVARWLKSNLQPLDGSVDLSVQTWLNSTNYSARRRKNLLKIYNELYQGFDLYNVKRLTKIKAFNKHESYEKPKYGRSIYARVDEFKVLFGPVCKQIENVFFSLSNCVKHMTQSERAKHIKDKLSGWNQYLASDFTTFESSFEPDILEILDMQLFMHMTQNLTSFSEHKSCVNVLKGLNRIIFSNRFKMTIFGGRMSGEMNTSLSNTFANLMIFNYLCWKVGALKYDCVVEGDDLLGYVSNGKLTADMYSDLGFNCKLEEHASLCTAKFCGLCFDEMDMISITDPTKVLLKTFYTFPRYKTSSDKNLLKLLRAKAYSIMNSYLNVPIIDAFGRMLLRWTDGLRPNFRAMNAYERSNLKFEFVESHIPMNTRLLMQSQFGYSVVEQLLLEKWFGQLMISDALYCPILLDHCSDFLKKTYYDYVIPIPLKLLTTFEL